MRDREWEREQLEQSVMQAGASLAVARQKIRDAARYGLEPDSTYAHRLAQLAARVQRELDRLGDREPPGLDEEAADV